MGSQSICVDELATVQVVCAQREVAARHTRDEVSWDSGSMWLSLAGGEAIPDRPATAT